MEKTKTALMVPIIGILILSVASSGCNFKLGGDQDLRLDSTLTATWKATYSTLRSSGFTVSGKLTDSNGKALSGYEVALGGEKDGVTNEAVKTTTTKSDGTYLIQMTGREDVWNNYGTGFKGISTGINTGYKPSGWNVIAGYRGLINGAIDFKGQIQQTQSSQWQSRQMKTTMLSATDSFLQQLKVGRFDYAANTLQTRILPNVSPKPTGTSNWIKDATLQKSVYNSIATAINDCRLLSGTMTESSTSQADTVYIPALIPLQT